MSPRQASHNKENKNAFVLTIDSAKQVFDALEHFGTTVTCTAKCDDEIDRDLNFPSLKSFPNSNESAINSLTISCRHPDNYSRNASITFKGKSHFTLFAPIVISIDGPESEVIKLRTTLSAILSGMTPWYNKFARADLLGLFMTVVGILAIVQLLVSIVVAIFWSTSADNASVNASVRVATCAIAVLFVTGWLTWTMNRWKARLFPLGVFAINQGLTRHHALDNWRWTFVGGVVIGFIVNIGAAVVASRFL